jgi:hypothetical protein
MRTLLKFSFIFSFFYFLLVILRVFLPKLRGTSLLSFLFWNIVEGEPCIFFFKVNNGNWEGYVAYIVTQ